MADGVVSPVYALAGLIHCAAERRPDVAEKVTCRCSSVYTRFLWYSAPQDPESAQRVCLIPSRREIKVEVFIYTFPAQCRCPRFSCLLVKTAQVQACLYLHWYASSSWEPAQCLITNAGVGRLCVWRNITSIYTFVGNESPSVLRKI